MSDKRTKSKDNITEAMNPEPETQNPKPETRNSELQNFSNFSIVNRLRTFDFRLIKSQN